MGSGILGLIGNYVHARHERQQQKDQEAYERLNEAYANYVSPDPAKFMANAQADIHAALAELIGDKPYKEHQPFIQRALEGVGNAVIGSMSGTMPMWGQHIPKIPTAQDPQTGQPVNLVPPGQVGQGAPPGQGAPANLPTLINRTPPGQPTPGPGQMLDVDPATGQVIVVPHDPFGTGQPAGQLATLAGQAQPPPAPPGPLPGGATPASTLAPPTTTGGVTPATATGTGGLIGQPGPGGYYGLPQDVKDVGRANFLAQKGVFGKTPQEIQGIVRTYQMEVQAGRMTSQDAIAAIQKAIQANVDPSTRAAAGSNVWRPAYFDPEDDKTGKKPLRLEENEATGLFRGVIPGQKYRTDITEQEMTDAGYNHGDKPASDIPKVVAVRADDPNFQAYMREKFPNVDLGQFSPDQKFNVGRMNRGVGDFTGFPTLDASAASGRNIEAQMIQAAQDSLEERNPQTGQWGRISPAKARAIAGKMFLERNALMNARIKNNLDVSAYKWGIPVTSQDLPSDVRIAGGRDKIDLGTEPPAGEPQGGAGGAGDAAAGRMQGLPAPAQQGEPGQTPNVVPGNLPSGAQPAAAGSPGAAPSASTPPQPPATHPPTVQPSPQPPRPTPAPAAAQQGGGGSLVPSSGVASDQTYVGAYMSSLDPAATGPKPIQSMVTVGRGKMMTKIADMIQREEGRQATPEEVAARLSNAETEWGAQLAAQRDNSQKAVLVGGIIDTIDQFAKQFIYQSRLIPDHGSLLANSFDRDIASKFRTNPKLASYRAAGLGLGTTWAQMIAGAAQSKAQVEVGALKTTLDKISTNAPKQEVAETMARILLESQTERWRYQNQAYKIDQAKAGTLLGKLSNYGASIGQPPPEPSYRPPPADGTVRKVRGTNQFVHYDAILGRYVAGAQ